MSAIHTAHCNPTVTKHNDGPSHGHSNAVANNIARCLEPKFQGLEGVRFGNKPSGCGLNLNLNA